MDKGWVEGGKGWKSTVIWLSFYINLEEIYISVFN